MEYDFYLASRSARRVQLLRDAGYAFLGVPADVPEVPDKGEGPRGFARRMALIKAQAAEQRLGAAPCAPVLGADTDVSVDGQILGKPRDRDDAIDMLLRLSNRSHDVHSAIAVCLDGRHFVDDICTEVRFGRITPDEANAYWNTGEPADKAGGYAIQGLAGRWVREIRGSYSGVVGLPLYETIELLRRVGVEPRVTR